MSLGQLTLHHYSTARLIARLQHSATHPRTAVPAVSLSARRQPPLHCCLGCDALILTSPLLSGCSHQRCAECCQRLPLPCSLHPRHSGGGETGAGVSEHGSGVVVAELDGGLLVVQVTRDDGVQYSGVLATDDCALIDVTTLPASPLLAAVVDPPATPPTAAPALLPSEAPSVPTKRRYVKSGIYSKKRAATPSHATAATPSDQTPPTH